jgi:hypothetical protein
MPSRRINTILWSVAALLSCAAAATIALAIGLPLEMDRSIRNPTTRPASGATDAASPELAAFEPIFQRRLRQSLSDVATSMPAEAGTPTGFQCTLAGTIGNSLALLRRADGSIEVKAVGESIDGAEVLAIQSGQIELRVNGERVMLRKPKEPEP